MKTKLFVLLLVLALSACAIPPAPVGVQTQITGPTAAVPSAAPTMAPLDAAIPAVAPWSLVAVGDSIPYNSPDDCHGCTSFVDRYAAAITQATGHPVTVRNLSQHNGLQTDGLLSELKIDTIRRTALANADIILVSIGRNDTAMNRDDDPCDGPTGDYPDWSKFNETCAAAAAEIFRPKLESVFAQIAALRAGKPTVFRTINAYNDWIGVHNPDGSAVPPEATNATWAVFEAWNAMVCKAAQANGFTCADTYHAFNGSDGRMPAGELIADDTIHPSDKGNERIAQVLADLGYAPLVSDVSTKTQPTAAATTAVQDSMLLSADLDKMFQGLSTANQFSGSVLIAKDGNVVLSKAYGFANREKNIPNSVQTKFRIYSMTKQFTAMAILMLQQQEKLNVQDKMCTYLSGCPESWKPITIHQLLTHTSGIPDSLDTSSIQDVTSPGPLEQMIQDAKTQPLDSQPGEKFSYQNMDYVLLGKIIEAVSGQSYEAFLKQNIFDPLKMSNTGYDHNQTDLAIGYLDQSATAGPLNMWLMFSAAGLYSTVEDLYRWDQALNTNELLPQITSDLIFTSYVQSDRDGYGYGYGWYISLEKPIIQKHAGHGNGFDTTIRRYVDDKVTMIILTNREDNDMPTIADSIAMTLLGK